MGSFRAKGYFEFTLSDVSKLTGEVYSPPFATSDDMFWQLKFVASFKDDPEYFSLFLCAIPNADEEHLEGVWARRGTLTATLYLKQFMQPKTDNTMPVSQQLRTFPIGMDNFCAKWAGYGLNRFYKKSQLPAEFTLGVEFDKTIFRPLAQAGPLPGKPLADELAGAWTEVLNKQEMADVRFNVQGHLIYACSTILSKRSVYFSKMFQQKWGEAQKRQMKPEQTSTYSQQPGSPSSPKHFDKTTSPGKTPSETILSSQIKYVIEVPDFHHATFLEMLRYLYTDKVTFDKREDSHRTALDMFDIADKYLIADLRQKSKAKICRDLNDNNAAELLFGFAWRYPDLKEFTLRHVVDNFQRVRKSAGYKTIVANPSSYPRASELNFELIQMLLPEEDSPKP